MNITEKIASFLGDRQDIEVVDVRHGSSGGKTVVQVLIDKEGGISLDDLTGINHQLSKAMDQWDVISGAYMLEVSSAGLERPLTKLQHYSRFSGRKVKILLHNPVEENRKRITGTIAGAEGDIIMVEAEEQMLRIPFTNIKKANLVFEMD